jgi:hypothetical protein
MDYVLEIAPELSSILETTLKVEGIKSRFAISWRRKKGPLSIVIPLFSHDLSND